MDTLWALLATQLALLLVAILVTIGVSIVAGLRREATASVFAVAVGLLVMFFFLRPKGLGRHPRDKSDERHE
jgi:hypothetical protein